MHPCSARRAWPAPGDPPRISTTRSVLPHTANHHAETTTQHCGRHLSRFLISWIWGIYFIHCAHLWVPHFMLWHQTHFQALQNSLQLWAGLFHVQCRNASISGIVMLHMALGRYTCTRYLSNGQLSCRVQAIEWQMACPVLLQAFGSFPNHDYMHRKSSGEHSDGQDSDNSSQASPNSRLRRSTFPVDLESFPSQGASSHQSSPMSQPRDSQEVKSPHQHQPERQSGDSEGQHQKGNQTDSPHQQDRRSSMDDGFNSDPEHSSRALRLKATHETNSARFRSPGKSSPRHIKGIRRAASEAQLMNRNSARMGSFGSHTSDSTRSFDDYLKTHRSPTPSPKSR